MEAEPSITLRLAVALALGLIVGVERGWRTRDVESGVRSLGMRTFALAGLLGGVVAALGGDDPWLFGLAFVGLSGFAAYTYGESSRASGDYGATTEVALLVTFSLGALAAHGHAVEATGAAVGTALLLGAKTRLHAFVSALDERELMAALQLLLVAIVVLPLLPDRGFGPYEAVNPRTVGALVLLVAGLSFAGYVAVRLFGARRGTLATALLGGLTSSTAVTIAFARASQSAPESAALLGAGIGLAAAVMAVRIGLLASVVAPGLAGPLAWPLGALAAVPVVAAIIVALRSRGDGAANPIQLRNPLQLDVALGWALLLALFSLLSRVLRAALGDPGLYLLAGISGFADVDAIGLPLARMARDALDPSVAARAIAIAALSNTLAKTLVVVFLGRRELVRCAAAILLATFAAGALALLLA